LKILVLIAADLERAPLGTSSRLSQALAGRPVLSRTLQRASRIHGISGIHLLAPAAQAAAIGDLAGESGVAIHAIQSGPPPYRAITSAGRAWGLESWRGGIGGLCWFDEDLHAAEASALAKREGADALLLIPAHAALHCPELASNLLRHYEELAHPMRLAFAPAPPGLAPVIFATDLLEELARTGQPPGALLGYHPSRPGPDLTGRDCCFRPPAAIGETRGRMLADTARGFARLNAALKEGAETWNAEALARWWRRYETVADPLGPDELEIELTTEDPLADSTKIRPRGSIVGRRGPVALELIEKVAEGIRSIDDLRIVLGGFGEPMCHPKLIEIVQILRRAEPLSIAMATSGLAGDAALDELLFDLPLDAIIVRLDAVTPDAYQRVHGRDAFGQAVARMERWLDLRESRRQVRPLLVPELMKTTLNADEMETFFDRWIGRLGCAVIAPPSRFGGRLAGLAVTQTEPPGRVGCRRLASRMLILADGSVVACDQDYSAERTLGRVNGRTLGDLWTGDGLTALRAAHAEGRFGAHPLCQACEEWHRP